MVKKRIQKKIINLVQGYTDRLVEIENLPIEKVLIFGSQARGRSRQWSDIDVCIVSSKFKDPLKAIFFLLSKRNQREVLAGLAPVGFTKKDFLEGGSFINEIKRFGVEI